MQRTVLLLAVGMALVASPAAAADPDHGRLLAQRHCASCHLVAPNQSNEVADAPPFDVIGRRHGFNASALALAMFAPHPKMNFVPARRDIIDLAAYIGTLGR